MLNAFSSEWNAVWKLVETLKPGVAVKDQSPTLTELLTSLKMQVTTYQQLVGAYNSAQGAEAQAALTAKIAASLEEIKALQTQIQSAITVQMEANKNAPTGALQMPQDFPDKVYNPGLTDLNLQIHSVISAMEVDFATHTTKPSTPSDDPEDETPDIEKEGSPIKSNVTDMKLTAPSWYKPKK